MYRFAPKEQTVNSVNVTVPSSSTHVSNVISVDHCVTLSNRVQKERGRAATLERRRKIMTAHHHVALKSMQAVC